MGVYPVRKVAEEVERIINRHEVAAIEIVGVKNGERTVEYYYAMKPVWHGAIVIFDKYFIPFVAECKHIIDAVAVMYSYVEEDFASRGYKIVEINVKEAQII
jgi:hypothetical protein